MSRQPSKRAALDASADMNAGHVVKLALLWLLLWPSPELFAQSKAPEKSKPPSDIGGLRPSTLTTRDLAPLYEPMRYALVIGSNGPPNQGLPPLKYAEQDAARVAGALNAAELGGFDRVVTLLHPNRGDVFTALNDAATLLRNDDVFLLYFSGHGSASIDAALRTSLFLLVGDSQLSRLDKTGISVGDVQSLLARIKSRRKVLIVDACYNGDGKSGLSEQSKTRQSQMKGIPNQTLKPPRQESEAHLFAAAMGQSALEDAEFKSGVYTYYFLEALRRGEGADENHDGAVSVAEAHTFSRDRTMARTGYRQVPWANYRIVGREDIYLSGTRRQAAEQALVYSFNERFTGARIYIDGIEKGVLPRAVSIPPGEMRIALEAPDGSVLFDRKVALEADHSISVDDLSQVEQERRKSLQLMRKISFGSSVAFGAAAVFSGLQTLSTQSYYQTATFSSFEQAAETKRRGERLKLTSNLLTGSAIAGGAVTGFLYLPPIQRRWLDASTPGAASVVVHPDSVQLQLAFEF